MVTNALRRRPPLRLTRRGRIVVLGFFILMASLASAILLTTASRAEERGSGPAPTARLGVIQAMSRGGGRKRSNSAANRPLIPARWRLTIRPSDSSSVPR